MARHTSRLCQECYAIARPTEYFPERPTNDGICCGCGSYSWAVVRVSRAEAQAVAATLFATPADRPACCNGDLK